ncbi:hypothetical protein [Ideonella paludis]|uniref:hypothetical protein n=1 Tax=Ideonella paludis TaxID=1233411 RepID=UPI00363205BA
MSRHDPTAHPAVSTTPDDTLAIPARRRLLAGIGGASLGLLSACATPMGPDRLQRPRASSAPWACAHPS